MKRPAMVVLVIAAVTASRGVGRESVPRSFAAVAERVRSAHEGVERIWHLAREPRGHGDLIVRVRAGGASAHSVEGGLRVALGDHALLAGDGTFIDGDGHRTKIPVVFERGDLEYRLPDALLRAAKYPAVLDPTFGTEIAATTLVTALPRNGLPVVAYGGGQYLAMLESASGPNSARSLFAVRIKSDGTIVDAPPLVVSSTPMTSRTYRVASDGQDFLAVWKDATGGAFARSIGADGTLGPPRALGVPLGDAFALAHQNGRYLVLFRGTKVLGARLLPDASFVDATLDAVGIDVSRAVTPSGLTDLGDVSPLGAGWLAVFAARNGSIDTPRLVRIAYDGSVVDATAVEVTPSATASFMRSAPIPSGALLTMQVGAGTVGRVVHADLVLDPEVTLTAASRTGAWASWDGTNVAAAWRVDVPPSSVSYARRFTSALAPVDSAPRVLTGIAYASAAASSGTELGVVGTLERGDAMLARTDWSAVVTSPVSNRSNQHWAATVAATATTALVTWTSESPAGSYATRFDLATNPPTRLDATPIALDASRVIHAGASSSGVFLVMAEGATGPIVRTIGSDGKVGSASALVDGAFDRFPPAGTVAGSSTGFLVAYRDVARSRHVLRRVALDGTPASEVLPLSAPSLLTACAFGAGWAVTSGTPPLTAFLSSEGAVSESFAVGGEAIGCGPDAVLVSARAGSSSTLSLVKPGAGVVATTTASLDTSVTSVRYAEQRIVWDGTMFLVVNRNSAGVRSAVRVSDKGTQETAVFTIPAALGADRILPAPLAVSSGVASALLAYASWDPPHAATRAHLSVITFGRALGAACSTESECESGKCVDGVCCDSPCTGQCQACNEPGKAGNCSSVLGAPRGARTDCTGGTLTKCGMQCTGASATACRFPATTVPCSANACKDGVETHASLCDGAGSCGDAPLKCAPYVCDEALCRVACSSSTECSAGTWCKSGACVARAASAGSCTLDEQCASGFCVDGVCCDGRCDGQCEACDVAGSVGTCAPVTGPSRGGRVECAIDATNVCGSRACDGVDRRTCAAYVGSAFACGQASCSSGERITPGGCDGKGACTALRSSCGAYACDDDSLACRVSCTSDAHCAATHRCDAGKCGPRVDACELDGVTLRRADGTTQSCAPARCKGAACQESCLASEDCVAGTICDPTLGRCVSPTAPAPEDASSCAMGHGRPGFDLALFLVASLLAARRRRPG